MEAMAAMFATSAATGAATTGLAAGGAFATAGAGSLLGTSAFLTSTAGGIGLAAGGVGAIAGPGLLASAFAGMTTFDLISGGFSLISGFSSIKSANLTAAGLRSQALFADFQAQSELIKGRKAALDSLEALNELIGSEIVRDAARGIRGEGSPAAAKAAAIRKGEFEVGLTRDNALILAGARRIEGQQLRLEAGSVQIAGVAGAAGQAASFFDRRRRRG